jgi:hypothetical protein
MLCVRLDDFFARFLGIVGPMHFRVESGYERRMPILADSDCCSKLGDVKVVLYMDSYLWKVHAAFCAVKGSRCCEWMKGRV